MAIPVLHWMLECTACGARVVVLEAYRLWDASLGEGHEYDGPALPERHRCVKGCSAPLSSLGSIWRIDDNEMWLDRPHVPIKLSERQQTEWRRLIQEPGYVGDKGVTFPPPTDEWWKRP